MDTRYRVVVRMTIFGAIVIAFCLVDGLVLLLTNGLSSDSGPLFPWLSGVFAKNHSSGAGLLVIGLIGVVVIVVGWFTYGRKIRAEHLSGTGEGGGSRAGAGPAIHER
jgi:hypothetical protein